MTFNTEQSFVEGANKSRRFDFEASDATRVPIEMYGIYKDTYDMKHRLASVTGHKHQNTFY